MESKSEQSIAGESANEEETKRPLGIVFDIDGTLIRESRHLSGICIRPHAVDFLAWCCRRGHRVALWTAGHWTWGDKVARKICPLVQESLGQPEHTCSGRDCSATFDFVWGE